MIDDTIAAVATALGEAGLAVVRVSGKDALTVVDRAFRPGGTKGGRGRLRDVGETVRGISSRGGSAVASVAPGTAADRVVLKSQLESWLAARGRRG